MSNKKELTVYEIKANDKKCLFKESDWHDIGYFLYQFLEGVPIGEKRVIEINVSEMNEGEFENLKEFEDPKYDY